MKLQVKKLLPIIIGIFLILTIAVTIFLVQQGVITLTRARPTSIPQNIQLTNIGDSSFTIVFTTELSVPAALRIPDGGTGNTIVLDDRDKAIGSQNPYYSHHITVPNLTSQQTYSFIIISDGKEYESPGKYIVTTSQQISSAPPSQNPLFGTVILPDGTKGKDTIVTARAEGSQVLSSITNDSGNYILPTNSLKNEQLNTYQNLTDKSQILLNFFRQTYTAKITTDYKLGQNLPSITLNHIYTFLPQEETLLKPPAEGFESLDEISFTSDEPTVISPRDNQSFVDQRPNFSGTGGVRQKANLSIPALSINETIDITPQGRWSFRPEENLPQGNYTAEFTLQNDAGISSKITRSFSILASGSQVSQSATPSATPTFTPSPSPSPTATPIPSISISPTPTVITSITPTIGVSITPTFTPSPSPSPTATPIVIPTSTPLPPIDSPGNLTSSTILAVFSIVLIVAGAAIFFAL